MPHSEPDPPVSTSQFQFHHLGVAVANLTDAIANYRSLFGYELRSGPFEDPIQQVTVCFVGRDASDPRGSAEPELELIAPLGERSPVRRLLSAGGGAYHMCFTVEDIESVLASVRQKGCLVISGPAPAVAFEGRRIAWFYTPSRQLVEVVEREQQSR